MKKKSFQSKSDNYVLITLVFRGRKYVSYILLFTITNSYITWLKKKYIYMYYICSNIYIYTYLTFHTTCYFLPNKTLVVSFLSSINITNYCLLLSLLLMCALVQVNLNIYLTLKKKLSAIFTILWGKKGTRKVFTEIFPDLHSELLPEILILIFLNNQVGSWKHHFLAKLNTNESSLWNFHRKTKLSRVVQ